MVQHCDGQILEVGGVFAFASGLPISVFNGCIVVGSATSTDLGAAMDWVASHGLPHRVYIDEPVAAHLGDVPFGRGFRKEERPYPGMVLDPIPATPPPPPGVSVDAVTPAGLEEFIAVVDAVGTRPQARRRGVGTALTWAAVSAGRDWGCETIVLDASEMGLPIYEAMGFRTVVRYAEFSRLPTTAA